MVGACAGYDKVVFFYIFPEFLDESLIIILRKNFTE